MKSVIALVLLVCVSTISAECIDSKVLAGLIDKAFETLHHVGADPVDWQVVHKDVLFELHDGEIFGLKNMTRASLPEINCTESRFASVKVSVELNNIRIIYPWKLSRIQYKNGVVYGQTDVIKADAYFLRSENPEEPLIFNRFDITEVATPKVRVTGADYLTWLTSRIAAYVADFFKHLMGDALENAFGHKICEILNQIKEIREIIDNVGH